MLIVCNTTHPLEDAAARLNTVLRHAQRKDTLLLLSGGSALALVEHIDMSLLGPHSTISVVDERWTYEAKDSNFTQLTALPFWHKATEAGVASIDPRPHEPENVQDTAKRFDLALKQWHVTHREGTVIATLGIGEDGHVAGVLPLPHNRDSFDALFFHPTTCVRGYTVPPEVNPHTARMTVTLGYLERHVDHTIVYAIGANKREALIALQCENGDIAQTPARVVHTMRNAHLFTNALT